MLNFKPLFENPGKVIQKFVRNFSFPGHETELLENSSMRLSSVPFQFLKILGHELDRGSGKLIQNSKIDDWMSFPVIRSSSYPELFLLSYECNIFEFLRQD